MRRVAVALALLLCLCYPHPLGVDHIPDAGRTMGSRADNGRTLTVLCTAYSYTGSRTYTETWPQEGRTVAVDPRVIPLGSTVVIDGHAYRAEDTGGLIKGFRVDIYIDSDKQAKQFGMKWRGVEISDGQ